MDISESSDRNAMSSSDRVLYGHFNRETLQRCDEGREPLGRVQDLGDSNEGLLYPPYPGIGESDTWRKLLTGGSKGLGKTRGGGPGESQPLFPPSLGSPVGAS